MAYLHHHHPVLGFLISIEDLGLDLTVWGLLISIDDLGLDPTVWGLLLAAAVI
jgi:hypothetical protein